jgi:hypothetical protein
VSDNRNSSAVSHTVTTVGLPAGDEFLIKALLRFLNGRACDSWDFVESNDAQVVIVDADKRSLDVSVASGQLVVESTTDMSRQGGLVLHRPVRSREFLELLNTLSGMISSEEPATRAPGYSPPPAGGVYPKAAPYTTKSVITRIRNRLGLAT